ncbi:peptidoglycan-binding protein [Nostoc sp. FACHB-87]|uniref:peptidoglycan-binding domain-containing protein n=1 Tax=Nostocales TaxID=1161 RepID=UPI001684832A|nr:MULTISPECIES: peptidoglycan-binding protein [Nostocales]MBD2298737.1 peptidoglycan-binding protein [Nostoc sp. FACHB-190]MBD2454507.1 peptidoglycan-binding protein [Nostoc sp. FACHB-87]MBD2474307.1 peptidoglycan-binding protein [Anabaena sp. FACHB-83]MBD2487147.1 peptidoglycan-binding protein [Aulosira sp. FACHB-615]
MDNLAYLHLAFAYEDCESSDLVLLSDLLNKASAPDWSKLSGKAWKYMLPLALTLSILSSVNSVLALERGDQGPSVRSLQQKLQQAGFYQAPITQVYDFPTEEAVRRFQKAAGLPVDGVMGASAIQKLDNWRKSSATNQAKKPTVVRTTQTTRVAAASTSSTKKPTVVRTTQTTRVAAASTSSTSVNKTTTQATKRSNSQYLMRGDEGEQVRVLQEKLRVAGYYYGNATGIFGPITEESVKRFQEAYKLNVDGIVGPATISKLPGSGVGYGEDAPPRRAADKDNLRMGDRGEAVRMLQEQLIKAGYLQGEPNGYFGSYTSDAVRRFQSDNYLAASGIAGPTTRARLYSKVSNAPKSDFSVLEIQRRLRDKGFYKGKLNGVMAEDTRKAIKQAQEFYGVSLSDIRSGRF